MINNHNALGFYYNLKFTGNFVEIETYLRNLCRKNRENIITYRHKIDVSLFWSNFTRKVLIRFNAQI